MWLYLEQVVLDEDYYPRSGLNWQTVARYQEGYQAGAEFPPIVVGKLPGSVRVRGKRLPRYAALDGWHRVTAAKKAKKEKIAAIETQRPKKDWFAEAVLLNVAHGLPLSPYDTARAIQRLQNEGRSNQEIGAIVKMRPERVEKFVGDRVVKDTSGNEVVVKASLRHLREREEVPFNRNQLEVAQKPLSVRSQVNLLDQLLHLLRLGLLDVEDEEVRARIEEIAKLLAELSIEQSVS